MTCQVTVLRGPARCGKTTRLLCAYRQILASYPTGSALWLSPNFRNASNLADGLFDGTLEGCLSPNLLTFDQLATRVLAFSAPRLRPLSRHQVRVVLRHVITEAVRAERLTYFLPIADTAGFLDLLVGFVRELKRLEIWPEHLAAAQGNRATQKDRELSLLYQAYQDLLTANDLYDAQGLSWAAREQLRKGQWQTLPSLRHVFVDGFTDFTRTEHDVLQLLATRAESVKISLPWDPANGREVLFEKVEHTIEELRRRHSKLTIEDLSERDDVPTALVHLRRGVFGNPRLAKPLSDNAGIEIIAAAGVTHEIELIAARVKQLLTEGDAGRRVAAAEVLVVFRSLGELAPLVREVFQKFGIPVHVASAPTLDTVPLLRAIVSWLRLELEDWPFRELLAALAHNYFRPQWPELQHGKAVPALESLLRDLQLPAGRESLLASVAWHEQQAAKALTEKRRLTSRQSAAIAGGPLLRQIAAALDVLPRQASCVEWSEAIDELAGRLGLCRAAEANPLGDEAAARDQTAWKRMHEALAAAHRLARWTGQQPPEMTRHEFAEFFTELLRAEELPVANDEAGSVRVLSAESVRGLSAPYVFVAGLSERAFPPPNHDDCVYSDADARRWGAQGLPLPSHAMRSRNEMLLFYEVITRATRQLVLSYPALDTAAQPLVPSPYLTEVEQACGRGHITRNEQPALSVVPANDLVYSPREFRVRAVAQALEGHDRLLEELRGHATTRATSANILAGIRVCDTRTRREGFSGYEGMLSSPAVTNELARRYGPDRCWSPSQLEQYAYCPFQFLMASVLRVDAVAEPELAIDHMRRGQMLHWLLSSAHRGLQQVRDDDQRAHGDDLEHFAHLVDTALDELRSRRGGDALEQGMREIDIRKIVEWLQRYRTQRAAYDEQWADWERPPRPAHFELAFGPRRRDDDSDDADSLPDDCDPLSTREPFRLECVDETILFAGRIDRIDTGHLAGQKVFTIVDYKSGKTSARTSLQAVLTGQAFQLPLYALAAEQLLADQKVRPFRAAYWHISDKGYQESEAVKFRTMEGPRLQVSEEWHEQEARLRTRIRSLIEGIRNGQFPMHSADDKCTSYCQFNTVCRVNQVRSLEKNWEPPRVDSA